MNKAFLKTSLLGILVACTINSNAQVSVTGQIKGLRTDSMIVFSLDSSMQKEKRDTILFKKGKISLSYPNKLLTEVAIYEKPATGHRLGRNITLYLLPGKPMTINGSFDNYTIKGCDMYAKIQAYNSGKTLLQKQHDDLNDKYLQEMAEAKTSEEMTPIREKYFPEMRKLSAAIREYNYNFIKNNPDNEAACIAVCNIVDFYQAYNLMTNRVKNSELVAAYYFTKKSADRQAKQKEQEKKLSEGADALNFTLKDINGKDFTLSSLRGKYVMLDFWGSWCGWCIKALPNMKECYNKHKDSGKFEIVSIDCNDTEAKWKAAVKQHGMTWTQVKSEKQDDLPTLYGVPGYPTFIIINPEGKIIKRFVGSGSDMYTYIDSLFE